MRTATLLVLILASIVVRAGDNSDEHNALFLRGAKLIEPYIALGDIKRLGPITRSDRNRVREGIGLLNKVVGVNPQNWSALFFIGKGHQALGDHQAAYVAFDRAFEINGEQPDVARELMMASLCVGKTSQAIDVGEGSVRLRPNDPGMLANLGMALLQDHQLVRAREVTERAFKMAPDDPITKNVRDEIEAVSKGKAMRAREYCRYF